MCTVINGAKQRSYKNVEKELYISTSEFYILQKLAKKMNITVLSLSSRHLHTSQHRLNSKLKCLHYHMFQTNTQSSNTLAVVIQKAPELMKKAVVDIIRHCILKKSLVNNKDAPLTKLNDSFKIVLLVFTVIRPQTSAPTTSYLAQSSVISSFLSMLSVCCLRKDFH